MLSNEGRAVLVPPAKMVLKLPILLLCLLAGGPGSGRRRRWRARLFVRGRQPAPRGAGLAAQPGQSLSALGRLLCVGGDLALGLGQGGLRGRPGRDRRAQLIPRGCQSLAQRAFLLAKRDSFPVELIGIPAWPGPLTRSRPVPVP